MNFTQKPDTCQDPLALVLERLNGVRKSGNQFQALCPAHDDKQPSLSVSQGPDGRVLLKCHAGCSIRAITQALGMELRDLFPQQQRERRLVATYQYFDEGGKLLFEVVRFQPKEFVGRRPDGKGGWIWNLNGVRRVLYKLPDVLKAVQSGETVFITEGEKDCDALCALGLVGTSNPHGAGKWRDAYSDMLRGAHVVILPDKDAAGRKHAQAVASALHGKAATIKILELPGDGVKDPSDWLAAGGTKERLLELVAQAAEYQPTQANEPALSRESKMTLDNEFTDRNNALILAQALQGKALWVSQWGWLLWGDSHWLRDSGGARILTLARELLPRHYLQKAVAEPNASGREKLCDYARRAHTLRHLSAALELAKGDLIAEPKDFDTDPWLLNCANGVLDLRTAKLSPHSPEHRMTKFCPVAYTPNAQAPHWQRFLDEIFLGDAELISYVQRACGYSLSGDVREDKLFICWGSGANGKSTLLQTLRRVLGDYAGAIAPAAIVAKGKDSHPTSVADLHGLRFAIAIETEEDQRMAEAQVKALTGRDSIKARFMHRDYFEFEPKAKIWLATNHRPLIRDTSPAIWRRIALIPFRAFFPSERQDKTLGDKLWNEREGILTWLVQGCQEWQRLGLGECSAVAEATEGYRSDMDALQDWLEERCVSEIKAVTSFKELYADYCDWCKENEQTALSQRAFGNRLTEKGFEAVKGTGGLRVRRGIRLQATPPVAQSGASGSLGSTYHILPIEGRYRENIESRAHRATQATQSHSSPPLNEIAEDVDCPF